MAMSEPAARGDRRAERAETLVRLYRETRAATEALCAPLEPEDYVVQSMPDASPAKWHLAHTTWFFETFVLRPAGEATIDPAYEVLFNSYYNTVGEQFPRPRRGLLTRPTVRQVLEYRHRVDDLVLAKLASLTDAALDVVELGVHHEQQHQELIVTDLKHLLAQNPLGPVYRAALESEPAEPAAMSWLGRDCGLFEIGHDGEGFAFDNEGPRHLVYLEPFALASRLVTNGEYLAFIEDGGYRRPELWLSEGWDAVRANDWRAPLYWERRGEEWVSFTLGGVRRIALAEPVTHVSHFEADAYARWAGGRLPSEAEWEVIAATAPIEGSFAESGHFHPAPATSDTLPAQLYGEVWQWTQSPYVAYPGYHPPAGALGEYNGKFMSNQWVLRGGSCATPRSHVRATYRNFFPSPARWQFSGIRLARDA